MSNLVLKLVEDKKKVFFHGNTYSYKDSIKAIPGNGWNKQSKRWEIPVEAIEDAKRIFPSIELASEVLQVYKIIKERNKKAIALKTVDDTTVSTKVKGLKGNLYPYQAVGKAFLDTLQDGEGAILAYDMGLGRQ